MERSGCPRGCCGTQEGGCHVWQVVDQEQKERMLPRLLQRYHSSRANRVLLFALYKKEAARLEQQV